MTQGIYNIDLSILHLNVFNNQGVWKRNAT